VRDQTEELASWALGESGSYKSDLPGRSHAVSDPEISVRPRTGSIHSESEQGDRRLSVDSSRPDVIEEVSEPTSPEEITPSAHPTARSALSNLIRTSPPNELEDYIGAGGREEYRDNEGRGRPRIIVEDTEEQAMHETTPLLGKARSPAEQGKPHFDEPSEAEQQFIHGKGTLAKVRYFGKRAVHTISHPKTWDRQAIWRHAVVEPFVAIPAVFLGLLLNILDALSYGRVVVNFFWLLRDSHRDRYYLISTWRAYIREDRAGWRVDVLRQLHCLSAYILIGGLYLQRRCWF